MKTQWISLLSALIIATSCVSMRPPVDHHTAKKKLDKHIRGIDMITKLHPDLKESFKTIIKDTVFIADKDDSIVFVPVQDTERVDSLLTEYERMVIEREDLERMLGENKIEGEEDKAIARRRAIELRRLLEGLKREVHVIKDTTFSHESEVEIIVGTDIKKLPIISEVEVKDGAIILSHRIKGDAMIIEREVTTDLFEVTVLDFPIKIKKVWLIIGGILILVIIIGAVVIKVIKPF